MEKMEVSVPERQLIEMLREQQEEKKDDTLRVVIEHRDGAWEIELSALVRTVAIR
jgi:hypothetical protein